MSDPRPEPKPKNPYDRYDDEAKGFKLGPPPEEPKPEPKPGPPAAGPGKP